MAQQVYTSTTISVQQETLRRRLPVVVAALLILSITLVIRMILFQAPQDPQVASYIDRVRNANYGTTRNETSARGMIYDRNGQPLAVNTLKYRIGISPNLVSNEEDTIAELSAILGRDPLEIRRIVTSNAQWELLATNVEPDVWRRIAELDYISIGVESIPERYYPQGDLLSQVIGFVGWDVDVLRGYIGVEGRYEEDLAGRVRRQEVSNIPFTVPQDEQRLDRGADIVLTIDRDIQYLAQMELQAALEATGAQSGTVIVMNPNNGDILAMISLPTFDSNNYQEVDDNRILRNPAVADVYEPGSVFKVLTVAAALEKKTITPTWTYIDNGSIEVGGRTYLNWDRQAYGQMDVEGMLVNSLNVGAASIAVEMGTDDFYSMISTFGIGQRTGVDLPFEAAGLVKMPNRDADWSPSDLGSNSFGQGISVTSLQMLNAVNVIANGGLLVQPRVVSQVVRGGNVDNLEPIIIRRSLSEETAQIVTNMMVNVVERGLDNQAMLPGYTIAGKTGTAQIANALGYEEGTSKVSFIGFLPADDPQISILVMLDRPRSSIWATYTAAPVFRNLAEKLVLMLEIPTDDVRYALAEEQGDISSIDR
jgi:cell division protein FtsI (penicillin-binding protein 3)